MNVKTTRMYTAPVPKMPPGLVELMEGLAKDVLKCNPPDVNSFCANHVKKLIEIRDGPSPKHVMTLEQKVTMAIKKIRERAERRRKDYDKQLERQNVEVYQNNCMDTNNGDARQYVQNKIVKISEKELIDDTEHEIIVNLKENSLTSESEINTESTLAKIKSFCNNLPATLQKSNEINNVKDNSPKEIKENIENIEEIENSSTNGNEQKFIQINQIESQTGDQLDTLSNCEEIVVQSVETENDSVSNVVLVEKEGYLECKTSSNNDNILENCENDTNMQNKEDHSNTNISKVSIVVDEPKDLKVFEESDKEIFNSNSKETLDIDETTLHTNENQLSLHFLEGKHDGMMSLTPLILPEVDESMTSNNSEPEKHSNSTSMDLETAAITIQKVFRNFLFKNKTISTDEATNVDINSLIEDRTGKDDTDMSSININKDRRTLGLSRMDTVLQTVNEEKSLSQSTDDSSTLSSAATIIQAHVRGYLIRNKLNLNKNSSTTSGVDSDGLSITSMEGDNQNRKNKTILNIHIVPESGHFMSRDESMLTSIDLSMDGSPPCSTNLHPLGYDRSERRKQLKREDAFQSISPPSNNSGKLSEDVDSIKDMLVPENSTKEQLLKLGNSNTRTDVQEIILQSMLDDNVSTLVDNLDSALEVKSLGPFESPVKHATKRPHSLPELNSDEMDVITPFTPSEEKYLNNIDLIHSGEFHEVVLPTQVSRSDTPVVRGE